MREATVTNKNPKTMTKMAATRLANALVCAPGIGLELEEHPDHGQNHGRADDDEAHGHVALGATGAASGGAVARTSFSARAERGENRGQCFEERDEAGSSHGAGAHRANVSAPEILAGVISGMGIGAGIERRG